MTERILTLRVSDINKISIIKAAVNGDITNKEAARRLGLGSVRQVQRLKQRYKDSGTSALIHQARGKPSNRATDDTIKQAITKYYKEEYLGWNFSHFIEQVKLDHGFEVKYHLAYDTLTKAGYNSPRSHKHKPRIHPPRARKENAGEMLQMDASTHDWLDIGKLLSLHGAIDDATGKVTGLVLCKQETARGYQLVLADTILNYGIPELLYTDFRTVFQSSKKLTEEEKLEGKQLNATRFANMCSRLGIAIDSTLSPQAKGRIERLWNTLQDRLPKELKKANITNIKEANQYIKDIFLPRHNDKFASDIDCSRNHFIKVNKRIFNANRDLALSVERKVLHHCYIRIDNKCLVILGKNNQPVRLGAQAVDVFTCLDGTYYLECNGKHHKLKEVPLTCLKLRQQNTPLQSKPKMTPQELAQARSGYGKRNTSSPWRKHYAHA